MADASLTCARKPVLKHVCKSCGIQFLAHSTKQIACGVECKFLFYQNKSDANSCWEWAGPKSAQNYGVLFLDSNRLGGRRNVTTAHRYSYLRTYGPLPDGKPCVMHKCDNPSCTNPEHLMAGSWADNNADRSAKGRSGKRTYSEEEKIKYGQMFRGSNNVRALLTEEQAHAIKYMHPELTGKQVGKLYGVSKVTANFIRRGQAWRHV